jgi:hypothetical protein
MVEGLTTAEAQARLRQFGGNVIPEEKPRPILLFLKKLWRPSASQSSLLWSR